MRTLLFLGCTALLAEPASACDLKVSDFVGWTIIYSGTVTGYTDPDGSQEDDFEGCEFDRILEIDYSQAVRCTEYSYSYAYNPEIVILTRGVNAIACIDNNKYRISLD